MLSPLLRTSFAIIPLGMLACGNTSPSIQTPGSASSVHQDKDRKPAKMEIGRVPPQLGHTPQAVNPVLTIMAAENKRWMKTLSKNSEEPAYYLAYQLHDHRAIVLEAEGGALVSDTDETQRYIDVDVRVGNYQLDNRHPLAKKDPLQGSLVRLGRAPLTDDPLAIRTHLWLETDRRYREAATQYRWVKTDRSVSSQRKTAPDFVAAQPHFFVEPIATLTVDKNNWKRRIRDCSRKTQRGKATRASCRVEFRIQTTYFVNSEGTRLQQSWTSAQIAIAAGVKTPDGMPLNLIEQRFAQTPSELPNDTQISAISTSLADSITTLHDAPVVDPYVGPAILEGRAAAVFFHEVFGHRVEGHRQKGDSSGQTFSAKVGKQIMPDWLSVYDDPTIQTVNNATLHGFYRFDDEGVRAQRASLVDKGVLRGFVLGRNPILGFPQSNGHGRKEPGRMSISRQGNLIVQANQTIPDDQLVSALIREVKRQNKPFGMIFTDISGGFTNTTRFAPQAFKVHPVMAYRIYPDGKKELVRGVDIVGTPLTALGAIIAAGRTVKTFNGMCGAESGWVPVSATAPSLLLSQLEVERGFKPTNRAPVLPPPSLHIPQ